MSMNAFDVLTMRPVDPRLIPMVHLPAAYKADFGVRPVVARHNLARSELFTDTCLIELLDHFPRQNLHVLTMGSDPERHEENRAARHEGVSGAALLRAVRRGRLWLNVKHVEQADERYRLLIEQLYDQLADQLPGFHPEACQGSLLISSPQAQVYYHVDGPATVLWHVRGRKRIWVYPAQDTRYAARAAVEDIFAGVRHEYLPYDPSFDAAALAYDLEPGQWTTWPQNAPHRVVNLEGVNVSLATEHFTPASRRRARVFKANRFFRLHLGLDDLSAQENGPVALVKTVVHRLARELGLDKAPAKQHVVDLRVDPEAPDGVTPWPVGGGETAPQGAGLALVPPQGPASQAQAAP